MAIAVLEAAVQDTVLHSGVCCRNVVLQAAVIDVDHACKVIRSLMLLACCMQTVQLPQVLVHCACFTPQALPSPHIARRSELQ